MSVDNVFVWAVIFSYFAVPQKYQFRVLFWGIFGALVLRAIFIFAGVALLETFDWILYVFGAFLLITAFRVARHKGAEVHPENNFVLKLVRRVVPSTPEYDGQKMFTRRTGKLLATPLFAVLILVETTDVVFAVDSIPAILAVSREPFIVFASNAFAILGLRALYFLLAGMADRFRYLNIGLGVILAFVGIKMIMVEVYHMPTYVSLGVIALVLTITIVASLRAEKRDALRAEDGGTDASPPSSSGRPVPPADGQADTGADTDADTARGRRRPRGEQPAGRCRPLRPASSAGRRRSPGGSSPATMPRSPRTGSMTTGSPPSTASAAGSSPVSPSTPT